MFRLDFLVKQFTSLPLAKADLTGRVAIITGANVGLGFEAAKHLATYNPKKLILACRNQEKGDRGVRYINETTNVAPGVVECWPLDLASFESVKAFAKRVETLGRLDILLENAGVASYEFRTTKDGWEEMVQVNALATFLLALLLLPLLRKTVTLSDVHPRIVILSSGVHKWVNMSDYRAKPNIYEALNDKEQWVPQERYPVSKLLDTLWTYELGQRLGASTRPEDQKISVSGVNPGLCRTELSRDAKSWRFWLMLRLVARTAEMGSRTLVHAAVGKDGENWKGEYLSDCAVDEYSPFVRSDEGTATAKRVWDETIEILRKVAPEVDMVF